MKRVSLEFTGEMITTLSLIFLIVFAIDRLLNCWDRRRERN